MLLIVLGLSLPVLAAPTVTGKSPVAGATWVSEYAPVTATFSEAMDPASITADWFTLEKQVGVVAIAAGGHHTVALKGDGTVVAWGWNQYGQTTVPAGLSNVVAITAGKTHTVTLKGDGTVVAWGSGQTTVPAGLSGVVAIAAGESHTVALKSDGTVVAWGDNLYGQTTVPAGLSGVVAVAAGWGHTVALKSDGTVIAWGSTGTIPAGLSVVVAISARGYHTVALKGEGTVVAWSSSLTGQMTVPAGLSDVVAIAAGERHTVALKDDGTVVAWGDNLYGQAAVPAGVVAIAAGGDHTVALKDDGTVFAWGYNYYDQTTVPAGLSDVVAIAGGGNHTVALKGDGTVVAWGFYSYGQTTVPAGLSGVVAIAAGEYHTVALKGDGTVVAWGLIGHGQTIVPAGLTGVVAIAARGNYTVALKSDGTVVAWGDNGSGQTTVPAGLSNVVAIAAGGDHTVALKSDGTVIAWGSWLCNSFGQMTVPAGLSGVVAIATGKTHTVALKSDGTIVSWGANDAVQTNELPTSPVPGTVAYDAGSRTATLTPDIALSPQSVYRATIFGHSAAGTPMSKSIAWTFSTGESLTSYLVTPKAGPHGKITPVIGQLAISGTTASFTLIPDIYYEIDAVTGCDGSLVGNTYTTGPVNKACTVMASFRLLPPVDAPASLTVPTDDNDGSYTVDWVASPAAGVTYVLQEATDAVFTTNVRVAYSGTALSAPISGRLSGKTYYYRVRARKSGNSPSTWGTTDNGCLVAIPCEAPANIAVPVGDTDGSYTVSWGASATAGANYVLQEATDVAFTTNVRVAYSGPSLSSLINWRLSGKTYFYRIRSTKGGYIASDWREAGNGCVVTQLVPLKVTVTSKSPAAGATWVPEFAPVTATFSEAMDPATITSDGFTLEKQVGVVAIAKGPGHTLALKGDGTVAAWGSHFFGEATVPAGLTGVVAVSAGFSHSVALKDDGTVVTWGGIQNNSNSIIPATVPAGLNRVVAIAAGYHYTVALKSDGTVVAWGYMYDGTANIPVTVPAGLSGVTAISAGASHAVALKGDGTVVAWGYRYDGTAYIPVTVPAGLSGVTAISAGASHAVALKGDGTVVAWGWNGSGQTTVPAGLSGVTAIAAGAWHTVALKGDGTVVAWGWNSDGQATVPPGLSGVVAIAAGQMDTLALKGDGTVVAWGDNDSGQISVPADLNGVVAVAAGAGGYQSLALKGDGTLVSWNDGNTVPAGLSGVVAIAAGGYHAAALKGDGTVVAWGNIYEDTEAVPVTVPAGLSNVVAIAAGGAYRSGHTVALKGNGTVVAWGDNSAGQATVPAGLNGVVAVAVGELHSVALKGDGTVVAWGANDSGQTTVPAALRGVVAIAAGSNHTVALKGDGTVVAWGWNTSGQTTVPAGLSNVAAVAAGNTHTVALKSDGTVVAWGHIFDEWFYVPATVPAGLGGVLAIAAGANHTVALKRDGTVVAWGDNSAGQTAVPASPYFSSVPATVFYNDISRTATLTPSTPLPLSSVYRATVFGRSANGTPMAGSHSWKFSTGEYFASFLVTPKTGLHGKISPAIGQLAIKGTTASFTLTPDDDYAIKAVTGCGGTLVGNIYTTGPINQACTVISSFRLLPAAAAPASITVPVADADGSYTVSWGASSTTAAIYQLQEATNNTFTSNLRTISTGASLSTAITGRNQNVTYYYRVQATKAGNRASGWRTAANGCAVPGTSIAGAPASLTVPVADADGVYPVSWGASATAGVTYELQESSSSLFTSGLRTAYCGTALTVNITGRSQNETYYYRVRAVKAGLKNSGWRTANNGCLSGVPSLVETSPTAGATSVSAIDSVTAKFSQAMMTSIGFTLEKQVGVVAIAAGNSHTVALKGDGTVVAWGANYHGQTTVPAGLTGVVAISAGYSHTVALKGDGTVVAWGSNDDGQTTVPPGLSGVVAIATGTYHTVALKSDGTVVAWGYSCSGQNAVPSGLSNVVAVAAGYYHTVALKGDGAVVAWGYNSNGATTVPSDLSGVVAIAARADYTLALKGDGTVVAWGSNRWGETTVPAALSGVVAIAAGGLHTVALKGDGTVVAWGSDYYGQTTVPAGLSGVVAIATGGEHTVALKGDGTVAAWGYNASGQTTVPTSLSPFVVPVPATVVYDDSLQTATLTSDAPLASNSVYRATVFGTSAHGIPMVESHSWNFSTGESLTSFLVTPKAGPHGKISPAIGKLLTEGATASFTLTPDADCAIDTVTGCGGSLVGNIYTTGPISQACTVTATFYLIAAAPASITVPAADADGSYTVSWDPSATAGVTYVLQEATSETFTTGLRQAYAGTGSSASITGRASGTTYYYRVRAQKAGYTTSSYRTAGNGCVVTMPCAVPASITVPAANATDSYMVSWGTSTTLGVTYVLQEATNAAFTSGLRQAYAGTGSSASITGRLSGKTYYYRVRAQKAGYTTSTYRTAGNGCVVGP